MNELEFDEEKYIPRNFPTNAASTENKSRMIGWLINQGVFKDVKDANIKLLVLSVIILITSFFIYHIFSPHQNNSNPAVINGYPI